MLSQTKVFSHLVKDYMGAAPVHCSPATPCLEVVVKMGDARVSSAVVVNDDQSPVGIITEQDVCRRAAFVVAADAPASEIMSAPVHSIREDDHLYRAIATMRRRNLRHMPVTNRIGRVVGVLNLDDCLADAAGQIVRHIEYLSHDSSFEGLCETKRSQKDVAMELLDDTVPTPEIQWLLTSINMVLHNRVVAMCLDDMADQGFGEPPADFDVIVMGSGGRGESYLNPDQDNGIIIADYPESEHDRIDAWFQELARRKTERLALVGFSLCVGQVMSTNTRWRKTLSGYREQTMEWISRARGDGLRYCDIFFDFRHCYGKGELTQSLRDFVTENAKRPRFLSQLYKLDEKHRGALNIFGHLVTDPNEGPNHGKIDLKSAGTLPLVQGIRLLSLREGIEATSTRNRMSRLHKAGHLDNDEYDYLNGAHEHISNLLLRQQIEDHRQGNPVTNHVPKQALTKREKDILVDAYKALRSFHKRLGKLVSK